MNPFKPEPEVTGEESKKAMEQDATQVFPEEGREITDDPYYLERYLELDVKEYIRAVDGFLYLFNRPGSDKNWNYGKVRAEILSIITKAEGKSERFMQIMHRILESEES